MSRKRLGKEGQGLGRLAFELGGAGAGAGAFKSLRAGNKAAWRLKAGKNGSNSTHLLVWGGASGERGHIGCRCAIAVLSTRKVKRSPNIEEVKVWVEHPCLPACRLVWKWNILGLMTKSRDSHVTADCGLHLHSVWWLSFLVGCMFLNETWLRHGTIYDKAAGGD
ncbi:hypothetical protein GGTG_06450 [Gaeumannomyces tritici R3-111a-1]|uniref:Uncharacterized protein n=1 Tax=Gaeumannomyces tritici (strain R3-111a-1) TaxID=644352 RepID=J3NYU8_GAET3|nr:hypothetical protein GGTG_06450 [Gaeumannomyces tritici R3-111a-1]EJT76531.1 hypothetical protein GGTG_06450 [Gaeumannomyces tritici R3-111a-1]